MLKIQSLKQWNWVLWMEGSSSWEHNIIYSCQSTPWGKQNKGAGLFQKFFQSPKPSQKSWQNKQHAWSADKSKLLQAGFEKHCVPRMKCYPEKTSRCQPPKGWIFILPLLQEERKKNHSGGDAAPDSEWETGEKWERGYSICIALLSTPHESTDAGWAPKFVFWLRAWASSGKHREREGVEKKNNPECREQKRGLPVTFTSCDDSDVEQANSWRCLISKVEFWWKRVSQRRYCCRN